MNTNGNSKVSVIIPVYNGSDYLAEAIDSALAQTYENIEVIVVNDGSTDDGKTANIAKLYEGTIRYFEKDNGGVATALNYGIEVMTGDYFSWLSHDDVYYPDKIENQIRYLEAHDRKAVLYGDYDVIDGSGNHIGTSTKGHLDPGLMRYHLIATSPIHGCTVLIHRSLFDECGMFDETLRAAQDYDLWFRMTEVAQFAHVPSILIKSRIHAGQGTDTMSEVCYREGVALYLEQMEKIYVEIKKSGNDYRNARLFYRFAIGLLRKRYPEAAEKALGYALSLLPRNMSYWIAVMVLVSYYRIFRFYKARTRKPR